MTLADLGKPLLEFGVAAAARLLAYPFTLLIPRDATRWIVIGRERGKFLDNAKHFFCWLHARSPGHITTAFLSENSATVALLRDHGACAIRYPDLAAIWQLLRAGNIVVDSAEFIEHGRIGFIRGARLIQIWHGAPLKEIELPLFERRLSSLPAWQRPLLRFQKWIVGRHARPDVLVSTSTFFSEHAFRHAFNPRKICVTGYPRNDAMLGPDMDTRPLSMLNTDDAARDRFTAHRANGGRSILYAPTFRKDGRSPFESGDIDLSRWSEFAVRHGLLIGLKLHPIMAGRIALDAMPGIIEISPDSDIYPILRHIDILVTDYSSIFFDFLLLDRPLVFHACDLESYVSDDRKLLFDYESMTPGPKTDTFEALLHALERALASGDPDWAGERERVRRLAFDNFDANASERLLRALESSNS
jgi:CDP-glycerol glycerophosphotransferase